MTNFSIYRKSTGTFKIPRISSGEMDIVRKTTGNFKIPMPQLATPPSFVSAEVGLIDAYTIDILLSSALNESKIPDNVDLIADFSGVPNEDLTSGQVWVNNGFPTCVISGLGITSAISDATEHSIIISEISSALVDKYIRLVYNLTLNSGDEPRLIISGLYGIYIYDQQLTQGLNIIEIDTTGYDLTSVLVQLINSTTLSVPFATDFSLSDFEMILLGTRITANVIAGTHVKSTSSRAITAGETGTIQYVPNALAAKKLTGLNGGVVAAFTESVTNNVQGVVIPVLQSITITDAEPTFVLFTYDMNLDGTSVPANTVFAISGKINTGSPIISGMTIKQEVTVRFYWGDTATAAYTKPALNMIKSTLGGEAASFTATSITNQVVNTYTKMLSHFDGADGQTSYSDLVKGAWTFVNTAKLITGTKKFGTASLDCSTQGNFLTTPVTDIFDVGSGDFTIDFWVYPKTLDATANVLCAQSDTLTTATTRNFQITIEGSSKKMVFSVWKNDASRLTSGYSTVVLAINTWYHMALVRNGNTIVLYVNGTSQCTLSVTGFTLQYATGVFAVGNLGLYTSGAVSSRSYLDEFRFSKGIARWTANFTPPTGEYTIID